MRYEPRVARAILVGVLILGVAVALCADGRPEPAIVTIRSGGLSADLQQAHAWNLQRVSWQGVEVCGPTGAYGTLLCVPAAGGWIGGAHTEGGVERVRSVALTVDGKPVELTGGADYPCERAELSKASMLDVIELEARTVIGADRIVQSCRLTAAEDVVVSVAYPFMYCVSAEATEWLAADAQGQESGGRFTGETDIEWHEGWRWTAAYMPASRTGFLLRLTGPATDATTLMAWWDTERYRKLYVKLQAANDRWLEGTSLETEVTAACFEAPPESWQEVARELAAELGAE